MYCPKCGTQLSDDSRFCYKCGAPITVNQNDTIGQDAFAAPEAAGTAPAPTPVQQPVQTDASSDDGVYGLVGFILSFFFPVVGLILSIIGTTKKKNQGLAVAGVVLSIVFIVLTVVLIILIVVYGSKSYGGYYYYL